MTRTECDDCGERIRENHMGQTLHRCGFKQESAEAAERLTEVIEDERDYWVTMDGWITLTLHESTHKPNYKLVYDEGIYEADTVLPIEAKFDLEDGFSFDLAGNTRLLVQNGHDGMAKLVDYDSAEHVQSKWIVDVEVGHA